MGADFYHTLFLTFHLESEKKFFQTLARDYLFYLYTALLVLDSKSIQYYIIFLLKYLLLFLIINSFQVNIDYFCLIYKERLKLYGCAKKMLFQIK